MYVCMYVCMLKQNAIFSEKPRQQICPTKQKWKLLKYTRIFKKWHKRVCSKYKTSGGSRRQKKHNLQQPAKTRDCSTKLPQQSIFAPLKSKDGATLRRPEAIKKRWCEHYSELLNRHPVVDESVLDIIKQHDPIMALDEVPSRDEIKASVSQMNNNKAPGMDGITAEILKNGSEKMIDLLEQVIQSIWESEVSQDWRDAILK